MIGHLCNSRVDIISTTKVRDSAGVGGWDEALIVLYKNLPCRIVWKQGNEKIMFDKVTYYRDGKLYCNPITIDIKCKIIFDGITYEIVDIDNVHQLNKFLVMNIKLVQ